MVRERRAMPKQIREEICGNCPHKFHDIPNGPHRCSWHPEELCKGSCDKMGLTQYELDTLSK